MALSPQRAPDTSAKRAPHLRDDVEAVIEQWRRERPDLDPTPLAVIGRLSKLARKLELEFAEGLGRFGINEGEFDVLCALRRIGPAHRLTPSELAKTVMISAAGMTKRLDALERAGLIRREPAPTDRRSTLIALTPHGKRVLDKSLTAHFADEERLLENLNGAEREQLALLLSKLLIDTPAS